MEAGGADKEKGGTNEARVRLSDGVGQDQGDRGAQVTLHWFILRSGLDTMIRMSYIVRVLGESISANKIKALLVSPMEQLPGGLGTGLHFPNSSHVYLLKPEPPPVASKSVRPQ